MNPHDWARRLGARLDAHWSSAAVPAEAATSRPDVAFAHVGDAVIRYRRAGVTGPSVILAADPPVPLEQYDELLATLAPRCRAVVFEIPGFGFSRVRPGFSFGFEAMNACVGRFIEQLGQRHVLAFPCVSAYGALAFAARRPDLISHVVAIQAPSWDAAREWGRERDPRGILSTPIVGQALIRALRQKRSGQWFRLAAADHDTATALAGAADVAFECGAAFSLATLFQTYFDERRPVQPRPAQPVLAVWGPGDRSHAATDPRSVCDLADRVHLVHLPGSGHFPELEASPAFAAALFEFLEIADASEEEA